MTNRERMYQGRRYLDDRLFILHLCKGKAEGKAKYLVVTRRNCEGFPPFRIDNFATKDEAVAYLKKAEPLTPRFSLDEKSPNPTPTYEDHLIWLKKMGWPSSIEFSELNEGKMAVEVLEAK